ncbi:hypothetical protein RJ639_030625, partial [Escallonia herrerae]
ISCRSPLPDYVKVHHVAGYPALSDPHMFKTPIQAPGYNYSNLQFESSYLSFAPPELSFGKYQADEQAWVDTINSVGLGETVRINTMDWLGQSQYMTQTVYWSSLSSAISEFNPEIDLFTLTMVKGSSSVDMNTAGDIGNGKF